MDVNVNPTTKKRRKRAAKNKEKNADTRVTKKMSRLLTFYQDPLRVYEQLKHTRGDAKVRERVRSDLQEVINQMGLSRVAVRVTGSCASGVGPRDPDIDLTLMLTDEDQPDILDRVAEAVDQSSTFRLKENIKARVPVLKLQHIHHNRPVDVTLNNNDSITMSHLHAALAEKYPLLKPMTVCLKRWARLNNLINPKNHLFKGFIFSLMAIFHQQQRNGMAAISFLKSSTCSEADIRCLVNAQPAVSMPLTSETLRSQLIDFFDFFANFDYSQVMNLQTGHAEAWPNGWDLHAVGIKHPVNASHNHAACVGDKQLETVKEAFKNAATRLRH